MEEDNTYDISPILYYYQSIIKSEYPSMRVYQRTPCVQSSITYSHRCIALFTRIIKEFPNAFKGYMGRGVAYLEIQNYSKAVEDFTKAIEILAPLGYSKEWADALYYRSVCRNRIFYTEGAIRDHEQSLDIYSKLKPTPLKDCEPRIVKDGINPKNEKMVNIAFNLIAWFLIFLTLGVVYITFLY